MQREVHNFAQGENVPDVTFLFGGYDWWNKCFRIWRIQFDETMSKFWCNERTGSNKFGGLGKIEIAGDPEWIEAMRNNLQSVGTASVWARPDPKFTHQKLVNVANL